MASGLPALERATSPGLGQRRKVIGGRSAFFRTALSTDCISARGRWERDWGVRRRAMRELIDWLRVVRVVGSKEYKSHKVIYKVENCGYLLTNFRSSKWLGFSCRNCVNFICSTCWDERDRSNCSWFSTSRMHRLPSSSISCSTVSSFIAAKRCFSCNSASWRSWLRVRLFIFVRGIFFTTWLIDW